MGRDRGREKNTETYTKTIDSTNQKYRENFDNIRIAIHNINGLKNNWYRLQELLDFGEEKDFNIIGIVETNIKETEAKYSEVQSQRYKSWWASAEEGKLKGSGVGILIDKKWTEHLTEIQKPNAYSIRATFSFRKTMIVVWIVYLPPNDKRMQSEIQRRVVKDISNRKGNTHYIVGGDFNRITDPDMDTTNSQSRGRKSQLPLIK